MTVRKIVKDFPAAASSDVNKPELLPKDLRTVIDVAGFLLLARKVSFLSKVFKMEQEEYNKEKIIWSYIKFTDSQVIVGEVADVATYAFGPTIVVTPLAHSALLSGTKQVHSQSYVYSFLFSFWAKCHILLHYCTCKT
ncbi:hypothetical protein C5167_012223 [Papaver somniferum]|uniref:Uncharacterized protein n=1 Tax=Papaver somniferum TaxID=3469 RepID=A0A4Y7IZZ6_PAPSO|nr:hypothetical protein C5167_012223 [Papaver somniferum]